MRNKQKEANQGTTQQIVHRLEFSVELDIVRIESCRIWALLHRRIIRRTHIHFIHPILFADFFYELDGLVPILWKGRVGMERGPILFRFFQAG